MFSLLCYFLFSFPNVILLFCIYLEFSYFTFLFLWEVRILYNTSRVYWPFSTEWFVHLRVEKLALQVFTHHFSLFLLHEPAIIRAFLTSSCSHVLAIEEGEERTILALPVCRYHALPLGSNCWRKSVTSPCLLHPTSFFDKLCTPKLSLTGRILGYPTCTLNLIKALVSLHTN